MNYVPYDFISAKMSDAQKEKARSEMPGLKGLFCYVFPYFSGFAPGNISLYARGRDYHLVLRKLLQEKIEELKKAFPEGHFRAYADVSPFPEVYAAAASGLGVIGKNGLLITGEYGSFVFIGTVATDVEAPAKIEVKSCILCGKCQSVCTALSDKGVCLSKCVSELTQRKGELTREQSELVAKSQTAWGCDLCQLCCPMNEGIKHTEIRDFCEDLLCSFPELPESNREFQKIYSDRAFIWRGMAPIKRNLELQKEQKIIKK